MYYSLKCYSNVALFKQCYSNVLHSKQCHSNVALFKQCYSNVLHCKTHAIQM